MVFYTVEEISKMLNVYKVNIYQDVKEGKLQALHVGNRIVINEVALKAYVYGWDKQKFDKIIEDDIKSSLK